MQDKLTCEAALEDELGPRHVEHANRGSRSDGSGKNCRWEDRQGHTGEGNEVIAGWRCIVR